MKAHEYLEAGHAAVFKLHGLSAPQYNVLRILRGAGDTELSCHEVGERMVKRVPDVTRLLDRLEHRGLIERRRCPEDRRVVRTRLTGQGLALVAAIDEPLQARIRREFAAFDDPALARLDALLDALLGG
ncbi:MAG: MarR family transcriptional regulator [Krumholzibacteria bacterium]|nr:MarR family transcriptional regulator [Candidatus Krumholzibacteria bacterium]